MTFKRADQQKEPECFLWLQLEINQISPDRRRMVKQMFFTARCSAFWVKISIQMGFTFKELRIIITHLRGR